MALVATFLAMFWLALIGLTRASSLEASCPADNATLFALTVCTFSTLPRSESKEADRFVVWVPSAGVSRVCDAIFRNVLGE